MQISLPNLPWLDKQIKDQKATPACYDRSLTSIEMPGYEVGSRKLEVGIRKSEVGSRKSEVGSRKLEVGSRKVEVVSRKSEVGSWKLEVGSWKSECPFSAFVPK